MQITHGLVHKQLSIVTLGYHILKRIFRRSNDNANNEIIILIRLNDRKTD